MKIGLALGLLILLFLYYNHGSGNTVTTHQAPDDNILPIPITSTAPPDPKLVVDVYYECLCPDSKYFITHHLIPTMEKVGSLMDIRLWPYGKATSTKTETGEFDNKDYLAKTML